MRNRLLKLGLVASLVASCDSDGDRFAGPPPVVHESPSGIYFGQITTTVGANPVSINVTGIVSEQGDVQFLLPIDAQRHYAGMVQVDGTSLAGTLTEYRGAEGRFLGIDEIAAATLDGTVSTADRLVGDYSSTLDEGQFILDYVPSYETDSSLDLMVGVWTFDMAGAGGGVYTVTWDVDANGVIFGTDTNGCVFDGDVSLIDTSYNAYRITVDVTLCGAINGEYSGLAYLEAVGGPDLNWMTVSVSNPVFAFATILQK
jgi:hypothetical protein